MSAREALIPFGSGLDKGAPITTYPDVVIAIKIPFLHRGRLRDTSTAHTHLDLDAVTAAGGAPGRAVSPTPTSPPSGIRQIEDVVGDYVQLRAARAPICQGGRAPSTTREVAVVPSSGPTTDTSTSRMWCEVATCTPLCRRSPHHLRRGRRDAGFDRIGYQVSYTGGGNTVQRDRGSRSRLVAANAAAQEFYAAELESAEAAPARQYLTERNF